MREDEVKKCRCPIVERMCGRNRTRKTWDEAGGKDLQTMGLTEETFKDQDFCSNYCASEQVK